MAGPPVKVYYAKPVLPDVSRVLACLYEKQIDFRLIDIYEGQHSVPADFLKLQSKASTRVHVPAFEDGETKLFESRTICRYLVEKYAGRGNNMLLGRDLLERASIEQWLKSEEHNFDPPSWTLLFYLAFAPMAGLPPDRRAMAESERKLSAVLDVYEQRLTDSSYLAGNEFTLADLFHLPNSHYLAKQDLFTSRENVSRWLTDISNRDSWRKVTDLLNLVPVERMPILVGPPVDSGDRPSHPAQTEPSQAAQSQVQPASPAQPVQSSSDASRSTTAQPEGPVVEGSPAPAKSQIQQAVHSQDQPASPGQLVQSPSNTSKSTPVATTTHTSSTGTGPTQPVHFQQTPGKGTSSHQKGTNGDKSSPQSNEDGSQNKTKTLDSKSTNSASNGTHGMQGSSAQNAQQSATSTDQTGSANTESTQPVSSQQTQGKGVSLREQVTNGSKSSPQSTKESSQNKTKTIGDEPTKSASNTTHGMQDSSAQIAQQSETGVSSHEQGTNDNKFSPQSTEDTYQKKTKTTDDESTKSVSNATRAMQGSSEQIAQQAATGVSPPRQDINGEKSGPQSIDHESTQSKSNVTSVMQVGSSEQNTHQSTTGANHTGSTKTGSAQPSNLQQMPGKGQGTGEKSSLQSTEDTSKKETKTMETKPSHSSRSHDTTAMQGSSEQTAHQSTMGTNDTTLTKTGSTQPVNSQRVSGEGTNGEKSAPQSTEDTSQAKTKTMDNHSAESRSNSAAEMQEKGSPEQTAHQSATRNSQQTHGQGVSPPEQGPVNSGPQFIKDTSQTKAKTMEPVSTQSGSNATPAMQGSPKQPTHMGTDHTGSTMTGSTQQTNSQQTDGQGVSSPEQGANGAPQSTEDTS